MVWESILPLVAGLVLLVGGAELLVRGASRLAANVGISPLVIGLTVVAYGTSAPELAVSLGAALSGQGDVAVGNVIGSNTFNVLFILGVSALIVPLLVHQQLVRVDVPIMLATSVLVMVLARDGRLDGGEGALLLAGAVAYTGFALWMSRAESRAVQTEYAEAFPPPARTTWLGNAAMVATGLVLLVVGARMFVAAAVEVARSMGASELVIGLTLVAAGTSLPEVATSVLAAVRGERDIAVGNVVGSNIFNLLAVLGASAVAAPGGLAVSTAVTSFDLPVMLAASFACLPIFFTGLTIARWEGGLFLGYYVAYVAYLVLDGSGHGALPAYHGLMYWFVLPLTAVTLLVLSTRHWRDTRPVRTA